MPGRLPRPGTLHHWTFLVIACVVVVASLSFTVRGREQVIVPVLNRALPGTCTFRRITGFPCPGCGLTRSFISIAHGQFVDAWRFNPAGVAFFRRGRVSDPVPNLSDFPHPARIGGTSLCRGGQLGIGRCGSYHAGAVDVRSGGTPMVRSMSKLSISDTRLHVVERGAGHPLLLVHGFPLDHQMWQGQIAELSQEFRVIAPDLRGFGQSDDPTGTVTMQQFADDLAELLETLAVDQPVAFCGLSMGGYIAWQFWRRHPQRLSHLILCDTRSAPDSPEAAQARYQTAERVLTEGTSTLIDTMIPKLFSERTRRQNRAVVTATQHVMRTARPAGVAAALRGMAQREDATPWLPEIRVPTLLVCGQEDAISTVSEMESIARCDPPGRIRGDSGLRTHGATGRSDSREQSDSRIPGCLTGQFKQRLALDDGIVVRERMKRLDQHAAIACFHVDIAQGSQRHATARIESMQQPSP